MWARHDLFHDETSGHRVREEREESRREQRKVTGTWPRYQAKVPKARKKKTEHAHLRRMTPHPVILLHFHSCRPGRIEFDADEVRWEKQAKELDHNCFNGYVAQISKNEDKHEHAMMDYDGS